MVVDVIMIVFARSRCYRLPLPFFMSSSNTSLGFVCLVVFRFLLDGLVVSLEFLFVIVALATFWSDRGFCLSRQSLIC